MTRVTGKGPASIKEASRIILAGGIVAYPTDTVYGLGCNPFNSDAVERLVKAKERVKGSLPVLVSSYGDARRLGEMNDAATRLANRFWPGPLTLVVPTRKNLPLQVTGDSLFVGLRIPKHETAQRLIQDSDGALIGTSANISGHSSPRTADDVMSELNGRIDLIVDAGPTRLGRESTVVRVVGNEIDILREGAISRDDVLKSLSVRRAC